MKLTKKLFANEQTRLNAYDVIEIHLTDDGTVMIELLDDACELSFDEVVSLNKSLSDFIATTKSQLKI